MKNISNKIIKSAHSYEAYRTLVDDLFSQNKTTGNNHSESMLNYTKLNISRMRRLDKKAKLSEETILKMTQIERPLIWLVITEGWCGDAAQIVPVLKKMADLNDNIDLKFILRDEHLDVIDAFLTEGGRSIPKVLILNAETLEVLKTWGPRPAEMQEMMMQAKAQKVTTTDAVMKERISAESAKSLHLWYARDKTVTTQQEFLEEVI